MAFAYEIYAEGKEKIERTKTIILCFIDFTMNVLINSLFFVVEIYFNNVMSVFW